ncbi:Nuclear hormone receptor family member nhr-4 [Aphelenchoides bicaudatus]|nr:Nuclear hormone receptor family member nhr-4 [Aphelenchoides bicaudatus]
MSTFIDTDSNTNSSSPVFTNYSPLSFNDDGQLLRSDTNRSVAKPQKLCQVCSDVAFGRHYACIGFFRRSLFSQKNYVCRFKNDCVIAKESRNACRRCRLSKCFAIGMNPEAVQLERSNQLPAENQYNYSLKRMLQTSRAPKSFADVGVQTTLSTKHFQESEPSSSQQDSEEIRQLIATEHFAWNNRDKLEDIVIEMKPSGKLQMKFEAAFFNPEYVSRRYPLQFNGSQRLDHKLFIDGWRRNFAFYVDFVSHLADFKRLSYDDQLTISKRRVVPVGWWVSAFHSYLNRVEGITFPNGAYHPFIKDPNATESQQLVEDFFKKLIPIFMNDIVDTMKALSFDYVEYVLIKALVFFRDEMFLSDQGLQICRKAWKQYARLLYNYILKKMNGRATEAVARYMEILNLIPPVLYLSMKLNEKVEVSTFFGVTDLDYLTQECHQSSLFNCY